MSLKSLRMTAALCLIAATIAICMFASHKHHDDERVAIAAEKIVKIMERGY